MNKPPLQPSTLSTVYLNNQRVGLMGDPKPLVSKIVAAGGKAPDTVTVQWVESPSDSQGRRVRLEEVIDRTAQPTKPIYLTSKPKAGLPPFGNDVDSPTGVATNPVPPQFVAAPTDPPAPPRGPLAPLPTKPVKDLPSDEGEPEWDP